MKTLHNLLMLWQHHHLETRFNIAIIVIVWKQKQIERHTKFLLLTNKFWRVKGRFSDSFKYLSEKYANAHTIIILCDGGGSNSSRHHIVKQDFMELASRIKMNIQVVHYPPYCSKYNPIEHRVFPHITREWSGAPLLNLKDFGDRAELAHTKKGVKVIVDYNLKRYDTKRKLFHDYDDMRHRQITTGDILPKLNYSIRPVC